jgi:hypothetical protein
MIPVNSGNVARPLCPLERRHVWHNWECRLGRFFCQKRIPQGGTPLVEPPAAYAGEAIVRAFLDALERQCSAYCILGRCDGLPAQAESDIDFMVGAEDYERLPRILESLGKEIGFRIVREYRHEKTARRYDLAQAQREQVFYLCPDACADYRRRGRCWLRAEDIFVRRRRHRNGFWIPSAADQFLYYFIKRLEKRSLEREHTEELSRLFSEDPEGCARALAERLSPASAGLIAAAARSDDWQPVTARDNSLFKEFLHRAPMDSLQWRLIGNPIRLMRRWLRPTGLFVAILGPDGSTRSGMIDSYAARLRMLFSDSRCVRSQPGFFGGAASGRPAGAHHVKREQRGLIRSAAGLLFDWADYVLGYFFRLRPLLMRFTLVVFDGCYPDFLNDAQLFRRQGPRWLARILAAMSPKPDLAFVLDAPADVFAAHEPEASGAECAKRTELCLELRSAPALHGRVFVVDASRTMDEVVHECTERTLALLAMRTAKALHLDEN